MLPVRYIAPLARLHSSHPIWSRGAGLLAAAVDAGLNVPAPGSPG